MEPFTSGVLILPDNSRQEESKEIQNLATSLCCFGSMAVVIDFEQDNWLHRIAADVRQNLQSIAQTRIFIGHF